MTKPMNPQARVEQSILMRFVWKMYPEARETELPKISRVGVCYGIIDRARIQNAELSGLHDSPYEAWLDAATRLGWEPEVATTEPVAALSKPDVADVIQCCLCGGMIVETIETQLLPYGNSHNPVTLKAFVLVSTCDKCGDATTDWRGEKIREFVMEEYRASLSVKPDVAAETEAFEKWWPGFTRGWRSISTYGSKDFALAAWLAAKGVGR